MVPFNVEGFMKHIDPGVLGEAGRRFLWSRDLFRDMADVLHFDIRHFPKLNFNALIPAGLTWDPLNKDTSVKHGVFFQDAHKVSTVFFCETILCTGETAPGAHFKIVHGFGTANPKTASFAVDLNYFLLENKDRIPENWRVTVVDFDGTQREGTFTNDQLRGEFVFWMKKNADGQFPSLMRSFLKNVRISQVVRREEKERAEKVAQWHALAAAPAIAEAYMRRLNLKKPPMP